MFCGNKRFKCSGDLQELARREMLDMIERLLLEADLEDQLPKLEVIVINIDFNLGKKFLSSTLIYSGDSFAHIGS